MQAPLPDDFLRMPIAHRALHDIRRGCLENSPSAIRAAIDAGYAIEIDLQISADGVPMVFHDDDLDRLTLETGPITARTAADLVRISLRGSDDQIATLAQILDLVACRVPLLIEIKDQSGTMTETEGRLEIATAEALATYTGPVSVMSFNPFSVARMASLAPTIARGLVTAAYDPEKWAPLPKATCDRLRQIPDYDRTLCSFISHEAADLARPRVAELKAKGAKILCWTVRSPHDEALARRFADNVTFEGYTAEHPTLS